MKFQFACVAAAVVAPTALAMHANPAPFETEVGPLRVIGTPFDNRIEEVSTGYTVLQTPAVMKITSPYVYATVDVDGVLIASKYAVEAGFDPRSVGELAPGMKSRLTEEQQLAKRNDATAGQNAARRLSRTLQGSSAETPSVLNNFILRIRFADHKDRVLPGAEQFETLMNGVDVKGNCDGDDESCSAPTGSIRDFFLEQSYGKLLVKSTITPWIDMPRNEAVYGRSNSAIHKDVIAALKVMDDAKQYDFTLFDKVGGGADGQQPDGEIDMFTIFHSGYGAEYGKPDSYNTSSADRVWSHKWTLNAGAGGSQPAFETNGGIGFLPYNINPGVWNLTGSQIGHLGVVAHESSHYLGLPDLYDTDSSSSGLGSFGLMANSWGFDGSQYYPPSLSAWAKVSVGFAIATEVTETEMLTVNEVHTTPQIFKFSKGYPDNEYVLMEYRGNISSDSLQPNSGLLFWKIDELRNVRGNNAQESYPGSSGWPYEHYHVALLEADGLYQLQKNRTKGDAGDVWNVGQELGDLSMPTLNNYNFIGCRKEGTGLSGNKMVIESYDAATDTFQVQYTKSASCDCNTECVEDEPEVPEGECKNTPGWFDADGDFFDCAWYSVGNRCEVSGNNYPGVNGEVATTACCACGGGSTKEEEPEVPEQCIDTPQGFYDKDGDMYNCAWYGEEGKNRCQDYGDGFANFGTTANVACCSCGGGSVPSSPRDAGEVLAKTPADLAYARQFRTEAKPAESGVAGMAGTAVGGLVLGGIIGAFVATKQSKKRVVVSDMSNIESPSIKGTPSYEDL